MKVRTSRARTPLAGDIELSRSHLLLMQKLKEVVTPCGPKILVHILVISRVRHNSSWPDSRPWCPAGPLIQLSRLWMPQPPNSVHAFSLFVVAVVICASERTVPFSAVPPMGPLLRLHRPPFSAVGSCSPRCVDMAAFSEKAALASQVGITTPTSSWCSPSNVTSILLLRAPSWGGGWSPVECVWVTLHMHHLLPV